MWYTYINAIVTRFKVKFEHIIPLLNKYRITTFQSLNFTLSLLENLFKRLKSELTFLPSQLIETLSGLITTGLSGAFKQQTVSNQFEIASNANSALG